MKKTLLLLGNVAFVAGITLAQQTPVSQTPQNKNVVLEELTGINCQYCPDGHKKARALADANPGRVVLVNIHAGGYATPSAGQPNLRTTQGTALDGFFSPEGYPAGAVQRTPYGAETRLATSRSNWTSMANARLAEPSPVNVALNASMDATTRVVTVNVEIFYTATQAAGTKHYLNVGMLQNNYEGPQVAAETWYPEAVLPNGNYLHQHMFRGFINAGGTWGEEIDATQTGVITKTITYTMPEAINGVSLDLSNLEFYAFLHQGHNQVLNSQIITGATVEPSLANIPPAKVSVVAITNDMNVCNGAELLPVVQVKNTGNDVTSLTFSTEVNDWPGTIYTWTGTIGFEETAEITIPDVRFGSASTNNVRVTLIGVNDGAGTVGSVNTKTKNYSVGTGVLENDVIVKVTTDRWGAETTWKIIGSDGTVAGSGGPYTNQASNGTFPQPDVSLTLANDCYKLEVYDEYGDGFDGTSGNGNIDVVSASSSQVIAAITTFTSGKKKADAFEIGKVVGLNELTSLQSVNVYPNPAQNNTTLEITTSNDAQVSYSIVNALGQVIITGDLGKVNGQKAVSVNTSALNSGIYFVNFSANGISTQMPLSIVR